MNKKIEITVQAANVVYDIEKNKQIYQNKKLLKNSYCNLTEFEKNKEEKIKKIVDRINRKEYFFYPYIGFEIRKKNKVREIGVQRFEDALAQKPLFLCVSVEVIKATYEYL